MKLINKDKLLEGLRTIKENLSASPIVVIEDVKSLVENLEVKEVDLGKEIELIKGDYEQVDVAWNNDFDFIAKHFFELGLKVNNPTTAADRGIAEEIIVNLKRIEQDYCIDLTKEMQWLRDIVKKGE